MLPRTPSKRKRDISSTNVALDRDQRPSAVSACQASSPAHVNFGVELELLLCLLPDNQLCDGSLTTPSRNSPSKVARTFRNAMHKALAKLLSKNGLAANYHDAADDDKPDYSQWVVISDGSISTKHGDDGYCLF